MARIEEEVLFTVCRFEIDIRFNSGLFIHDLEMVMQCHYPMMKFNEGWRELRKVCILSSSFSYPQNMKKNLPKIFSTFFRSML